MLSLLFALAVIPVRFSTGARMCNRVRLAEWRKSVPGVTIGVRGAHRIGHARACRIERLAIFAEARRTYVYRLPKGKRHLPLRRRSHTEWTRGWDSAECEHAGAMLAFSNASP
jgi:hypothetical protein